jgi:hypothetical protein
VSESTVRVFGEPTTPRPTPPPLPTQGDSLDAAWAEAEAALPTAGWAAPDGRWVIPDGGWHIVIEYLQSGDGYFEPHAEGYRASAYINATHANGNHGDIRGGIEPSPDAALRALAARLRADR